MRRRLDLAASLVGRPQVLFLDEPTTGLDPARRNDLWEIVRSLSASGTTVLLTTQYMEEAEALAEDIAVMDKGRFIARGTADELKVRIAGRGIRLRAPIGSRPTCRRCARCCSPSSAWWRTLAPGTVGGPVSEDDQVARLLKAVAAADIAIADISTVTASLDEVFLALAANTKQEENGWPRQASLPTPTNLSSRTGLRDTLRHTGALIRRNLLSTRAARRRSCSTSRSSRSS